MPRCGRELPTPGEGGASSGPRAIKADADSTVRLDDPPGALDQLGESTSVRAKTVFNIWVIVFALVGAQMSWVLRPFIGHPERPFEFFRARAGNFFMAVFEALRTLLAG